MWEKPWHYYFSALNRAQVECCIGFLEWYRDNVELINDQTFAARDKFIADDLAAIEKALPVWENKLLIK